MSQLPDYVASAQPNSFENRAPWLTTTAATYAGIMLWFVFWANLPGGGAAYAGGVLSQGLLFALISVVVAAFICYTCFYHVPGMLGMKTGLPLYIVGTSTYGVKGGFIMPGFTMGCLQFGWLAVNGYGAGGGFAVLLFGLEALNGPAHIGIGFVWAAIAAFVGLKGIKYVGIVATWMPIIPIVVLLYLLFTNIGGIFSFDPSALVATGIAAAAAAEPAREIGPYGLYGLGILGSFAGQLGVLSLICVYVVGFFATAGAAGCDFGSNNKDRNAVIFAGLVGIVGAIVFTGVIALIVVAGAQEKLALATAAAAEAGEAAPSLLNPYLSMAHIVGPTLGGLFILLLAIAAFPSACFSSLIAANSFKTTLPKVNPFISCGIGTGVACLLIIVMSFEVPMSSVFKFIGAMFGPVCGAMMADYLLSGKKWAGPREGFNLPGWISWGVGFLVGGLPILGALTFFAPVFGIFYAVIPCPPVAAFVVGFVLYYILARAGLESKKLDMPQRIDV